MNPFNRLAPFIQEYIYRHHWDELRDVQVQAISEILDTQNHVLIAAGTASGKTEAAFFPILTLLTHDKRDSFGVLYVGPLKALINDQFQRIEFLLEDADFPIYAWHGDRPQSEKGRAVNNPHGVLQITPESLEGLLMNRSGDAKRMFANLQFVVIDELHAFTGTDRGLQLQCQLIRLERLIGREIRRIGLSATINDYSAAKEWLSAGSKKQTDLVVSESGGRKLNIAMQHYEYSEDEEQAESQKQQMYDYLYEQVCGRKCLVFTNSRMESEMTANQLTERVVASGESDQYYVHHGSISKSLREETESALRNSEKSVTAIATKTLELGIDLGSLERVVQIGAPNTCSSFVQRLGRTGRRGTPAVMRFITENTIRKETVFDDLPWELVQNIAIVQLYLEQRWVESFVNKRAPFSVLFHQFLSSMMEKEQTAKELAANVLTYPAFRYVSHADALDLLKHMLSNDVLEKTEQGTLIPGLLGERIAQDYRFLSVFKETLGWTVLHLQREIGEIDNAPTENSTLALAGRIWRVCEIDEQRKRVYVQPSKGKVKNNWNGGGGEIDDKVVSRMKQVLVEDVDYPYLLTAAKSILDKARNAVRAMDLDRIYTSYNEHAFLLHPWIGSRKLKTLLYLLQRNFREPLKIQSVAFAGEQTGLYITSDLAPDMCVNNLVKLCISLTEDALLSDAPSIIVDRYDEYLPDNLLKKAYVQNQLDVEGIVGWAKSVMMSRNE